MRDNVQQGNAYEDVDIAAGIAADKMVVPEVDGVVEHEKPRDMAEDREECTEKDGFRSVLAGEEVVAIVENLVDNTEGAEAQVCSGQTDASVRAGDYKEVGSAKAQVCNGYTDTREVHMEGFGMGQSRFSVFEIEEISENILAPDTTIKGINERPRPVEVQKSFASGCAVEQRGTGKSSIPIQVRSLQQQEELAIDQDQYNIVLPIQTAKRVSNKCSDEDSVLVAVSKDYMATSPPRSSNTLLRHNSDPGSCKSLLSVSSHMDLRPLAPKVTNKEKSPEVIDNEQSASVTARKRGRPVGSSKNSKKKGSKSANSGP